MLSYAVIKRFRFKGYISAPRRRRVSTPSHSKLDVTALGGRDQVKPPELTALGGNPARVSAGAVLRRPGNTLNLAPRCKPSVGDLTMNFEQARYNMIEQQIRTWEVLDPRVLNTLQDVPREEFVPERYRNLAFTDMQIRLPHGQVMMQPKVEARLLQELAVQATDQVLEIGTGSGYMTALLASLAERVDSVELYPDLLETAREKLAASDFTNTRLQQGDAAHGWPGDGPYDAIILTGSVPLLPAQFADNLRPGGRLMAVVGEDPIMEALLIERGTDGSLTEKSLFETSLPALVHAERPPAFVF